MTTVSPDDGLAVAAALVGAAQRILVLTGAGISTESGISDYRGPEGVWTRKPGAERLSTIGPYSTDPEVRREAWQMRIEQAAWRREPNAGHRAIVELEAQGRLDLLVTQNVDGLHAKAGTSADRLVEIHGSLRNTQCLDCDERLPIEETIARVEGGIPDPRCRCSGVLKPTVVFFGQGLDDLDLARAVQSCKRADLVLAAGTSLQVHPVAALPELALDHGARLIIANAEPTPLDHRADAVVRGRLGVVLPALVEAGRTETVEGPSGG